jgi:hypothetical protein
MARIPVLAIAAVLAMALGAAASQAQTVGVTVGSGSVTNTSNLSPNVGVEFTANGGAFTNALGATINAQPDTNGNSKIFSGSDLTNFNVPFSNLTVNNAGTLEYQSNPGSGSYFAGNPIFTGSTQTGVTAVTGITINNAASGVIAGLDTSCCHDDVPLSFEDGTNGAVVNNLGTISTAGTSVAGAGVRLLAGLRGVPTTVGNVFINNQLGGVIKNTGSGSAILLQQNGFNNTFNGSISNVTINNNGTITGAGPVSNALGNGVAISFGAITMEALSSSAVGPSTLDTAQISAVNINNTGTIDGTASGIAIDNLNNADPIAIINSGRIKGNVLFGSAGDNLQLTGGSVQGNVVGQSAGDTVTIGAGSGTAAITGSVSNVSSVNVTSGTANFGSGLFTVSNAGGGTVSIAPGSIASGARFTLTANPASGYIFTGWGGACGGTSTCTVTLNANTTVAASFVASPSPLVASVVPSSQSVEVGTTATATATIINGGSTTASQCAIAPIGTLAATFSYQAVPGGRPNTPVDIPAGGTANFNISLTPTAAIVPGVNVQFSFACANARQATVLTGLNTLFLSAATTPVANIVTTATVANNSNGILVLNQTGANTGSGSFAVSTSNQGIGAVITATTNTGTATLPVIITLCQTNPTSGQCLAPPGPSVTLTINAGDTPTFAVFVTATGAIPFDLNNNRIFVQFTSTTNSSPNGAAATSTTIISGEGSVAPSFTQSNPSSGLNPLAAAVLPLSRSVEAGATPTAFATIINPNSTAATSCAIAPDSVPVSFLYQTTNPTTNALTGTANTAVDIGPGMAQTYVFALTPTAVFGPRNVEITFSCDNALASINLGVNTLSLSASAIPVPDIVALAASGDPGYVDIPGATGTGVFAVATVNLGIDGMITASANTGTANLPVTLTVCQTNPVSGACLAAPAPSVATDIQPNATPTFGIFVAGSAAVANLPGVNRVFVTFTDSGGTLRGETSVAVRTQ